MDGGEGLEEGKELGGSPIPSRIQKTVFPPLTNQTKENEKKHFFQEKFSA